MKARSAGGLKNLPEKDRKFLEREKKADDKVRELKRHRETRKHLLLTIANLHEFDMFRRIAGLRFYFIRLVANTEDGRPVAAMEEVERWRRATELERLEN